MNVRILGLLGMAASPFLATDFIVGHLKPDHYQTSLSGVFSLIYMTGWMCSIIGLYKLNATGNSFLGKLVLIVQLVFLSLGEMWNVYDIINPSADSFLFRLLDIFWPGSNLFMIITGLMVIKAKKLSGWERYIPFAAGLWLPLSFLSLQFTESVVSLIFSCLYSATAWFLLGFTVVRSFSKLSPYYAAESE